MYDKIEDDAWLCPGYDELKKGKMYHSTMLTHRKGAHMQLTWQKDMACQIRLYKYTWTNLIQKLNTRDFSDLFNSLGTKVILAGKFRDVLGYFCLYNSKPMQSVSCEHQQNQGDSADRVRNSHETCGVMPCMIKVRLLVDACMAWRSSACVDLCKGRDAPLKVGTAPCPWNSTEKARGRGDSTVCS